VREVSRHVGSALIRRCSVHGALRGKLSLILATKFPESFCGYGMKQTLKVTFTSGNRLGFCQGVERISEQEILVRQHVTGRTHGTAGLARATWLRESTAIHLRTLPGSRQAVQNTGEEAIEFPKPHRIARANRGR
jgi:hypothetical protein